MQTNSNMTTWIIPTRKQHAWAWLSVMALAMIMLLSACGGTTSTNSSNSSNATAPVATNTPANSGSGSAVMIMNDSSGSFAFSPTTLTIKVGTTVTWKNVPSVAHTVTSDDGKSFDSGSNNPIAAQSGTYSFTFTKPGTYAYHCSFHPFMKATIVVQ
ncbi:MAG TPA: plastocyanin/azurin family copper-binding protein [Ktedonobacteraceae bacterium]